MKSIRAPLVDPDTKEGRVLLASVAHELRTPLSTLVHSAASLRGVIGNNQIGVAALEMIQRQAAVLTRLANDLVDATRMETGEFSAAFELIDEREVLHWAARTCAPAMQARGHNFLELLLDGPMPVVGDHDRLVQVFVNLLDNAIKYTPAGGKIWLIATAEGDEAVVRVRDTGVGMSSSTLPRLFKPFSQDPSTKSMANGGVGIGLSLVRSIVTLHKGSVHAQSGGHGKGSEFTVRLPLCTLRS